MDNNLSIPLRNFNDKVRVMNQSQSPTLILSRNEAQVLHTEVFALLAQIAELSRQSKNSDEVVTLVMDGGGFK